jgi:hypothetical protein
LEEKARGVLLQDKKKNNWINNICLHLSLSFKISFLQLYKILTDQDLGNFCCVMSLKHEITHLFYGDLSDKTESNLCRPMLFFGSMVGECTEGGFGTGSHYTSQTGLKLN